MRHFHLKDPSGVYPRVLVSISIALGCLDWDNSLIVIHRVLYWVDFSIQRNMSLYHLLMTFTQALRVPNKSTPIREVFSSGFRDSIRLLINIKLFQPVSFA